MLVGARCRAALSAEYSIEPVLLRLLCDGAANPVGAGHLPPAIYAGGTCAKRPAAVRSMQDRCPAMIQCRLCPLAPMPLSPAKRLVMNQRHFARFLSLKTP